MYSDIFWFLLYCCRACCTELQSERTVTHAADTFIRSNSTAPVMVNLQVTTLQKLKWFLQNCDLSLWPVVESKNWPFTKIGTKCDKFKWKCKCFAGTKIIEVIGKIIGLKRMVKSCDKMYVTGMSVSFIVNWFACLHLQVNCQYWDESLTKTNFSYFSRLHYCTLCLFTA